MTWNEIGIEPARKKLGALVAAAQRGQTTILTRNRTPAAMITPVPLHLALRDISVEAIDQGNWRDQAIQDWIEAAAEEGYGFTVRRTHYSGDVLAVLAEDKWIGDEITQGEPLALLVDRTHPDVAEGDGDTLDIHPGLISLRGDPGPADAVQSDGDIPDRPATADMVVAGRFRVQRNGSGGISLDWGDGEIDMGDDDAEQLAAALATVRRQPR
jgi:antitoxin (DNA-binding transcriptional repressor) of toxin-antitoxin stability system